MYSLTNKSVVGTSNFNTDAIEVIVRDKKMVKDREIGVVRVPLKVLVGKLHCLLVYVKEKRREG